MAIFDYSGMRVTVRHGNRYTSNPYIEIDESSVALAKTYWFFNATVDGSRASFRYYGKNMDDIDKFTVQKGQISIESMGSYEFREINWSFEDVATLTLTEQIRKSTKNDDVVYGGSKKDFLYGETGNDSILGKQGKDRLYGGEGNDRLYGGKGNDLLDCGTGMDRVWGQRGRDTFRIKRGDGYAIIEDFSDGEDRILLGSGKRGLNLETRGDDVYVYKKNDLMAIVNNAAGDLQRDGKFLL